MIKRILVMLTMLTAISAISITPASASNQFCGWAGQGCLWTEAQYTGSKVHLAFSTWSGHCYAMSAIGPGWDNAVTSMEADYGYPYHFWFYTAAGCSLSENEMCLGRGCPAGWPNPVGQLQTTFDDHISSFWITSSKTP
jgi:hypothetical protein